MKILQYETDAQTVNDVVEGRRAFLFLDLNLEIESQDCVVLLIRDLKGNLVVGTYFMAAQVETPSTPVGRLAIRDGFACVGLALPTTIQNIAIQHALGQARLLPEHIQTAWDKANQKSRILIN